MKARNKRLQTLVLIIGAAASVATSKTESGGRQSEGCPEGRSCSPATPRGLYFSGTILGDRWLGSEVPQALALGGTQTIRVFYDPEGEMPFDLPFVPTTEPGISAGAPIANTVRVLGQEAGDHALYLEDPDSSEIYDFYRLSVRPIDEARLVPSSLYWIYDLEAFSDELDIVYLIGGEADMTVALYSAEGLRLADESLGINAGANVGTRGDSFDRVLVSPQGSSQELGVDAGDRNFSIAITGVGAADEIVQTNGDSSISSNTEDGSLVCFRAQSEGALVLGASWTFQGGPGLILSQHSDRDIGADHCIVVRSETPGNYTLTVSGAGQSETFAVDIVEESGARTRDIARTRPTQAWRPNQSAARAGERAFEIEQRAIDRGEAANHKAP